MAKLAGLPGAVIDRAKVVLAEAEDRTSPARRLIDDLPLFSAAARAPAAPPRPDPAFAAVALAALNPDDLSPREALEALTRSSCWRRGGRKADREAVPSIASPRGQCV